MTGRDGGLGEQRVSDPALGGAYYVNWEPVGGTGVEEEPEFIEFRCQRLEVKEHKCKRSTGLGGGWVSGED